MNKTNTTRLNLQIKMGSQMFINIYDNNFGIFVII